MHIYTGKNLAFQGNGKFNAVDDTHPKFAEIVDLAVNKGDYTSAAGLVDVRSAVVDFTSGTAVDLRGDTLFYKGTAVSGLLGERIIQMSNMGLTVSPLISFLENMMDNPSSRAVEELYGFLEVSKLPITDDGHFLAYKSVDQGYMDHHSGTIDNSVGQVVSMQRNTVDEDKDRLCSNGLHFAAHEYAEGFQRSGRMMVLKINPRDVVAIPSDYNNQKGRCCEYEVIEEVKRDDQKLVGAGVIGAISVPAYSHGTPDTHESRKIPAGNTKYFIGQRVTDTIADSRTTGQTGTVVTRADGDTSWARVQWDSGYVDGYCGDRLTVVGWDDTQDTPVPPAPGDTWTKNEGKLPVDAGTKVDVKHNDGRVFTDEIAGLHSCAPDAGHAEDWSIDGVRGDIVEWKLTDVPDVPVDTPVPYVPQADNYGDQDLWDGRDEFIGKAKEFPVNRQTPYLLVRNSDGAEYAGYFFVDYQVEHDNLVFRKFDGLAFRYCTVSDVSEWSIEWETIVHSDDESTQKYAKTV